MGHPDTMRLHRVALTIVVVAYVTCRVGSGEEGGREGGRREEGEEGEVGGEGERKKTLMEVR